MPFKHKHIHSAGRLHERHTDSTITHSTITHSAPSDNAVSTRLSVASSSSSLPIISAGSQLNANNQDDELSSIQSTQDNDNDNDDDDAANSNTIFKTRDAFEAYARVRFAATTQPTSRGAEKKNTPNVISMSCRNARSAQAVDEGTSCTWSMKAQFFNDDDDQEEKGWKVVKDVQLHNAACIARASKFGKAAKVKAEQDEEVLGLEGEGDGSASPSTSARSKRQRLSKASKSTCSSVRDESSKKTTCSTTTARKRAKSPDYSKMSLLFDKVYNLRRATVKRESPDDELGASSSHATQEEHLPQRRSNRIPLAKSKVRVKQEEMDNYDYSPSYFDHQQRQASTSFVRDDTPNPPICINGNNAAHAQLISSSSLSPVSVSFSNSTLGSGTHGAMVSPRSSRSSSLTSLDDLDEDADADSDMVEGDASAHIRTETKEDEKDRSPCLPSAVFPDEGHVSDTIVQQVRLAMHTSAHAISPAAAREASTDLVKMPETILSSPMRAHKRPSFIHSEEEEDAVDGALALAMLSKSPSPAAHDRLEGEEGDEGNDSGCGMGVDLDSGDGQDRWAKKGGRIA